MTQLSDLERLTALEQIKLLKARRDRAADTHDWDLYESLHAPDHRSYGDDYGQWTSAAQMIANVKRAMRGLLTLHHSHTPMIDFQTAEKAKGVWAMKGMSFWQQNGEPRWFLAFGHYFEEYEKRAGIWKFTSRRLKYYHTERSPGAIFPPEIDAVEAADAQPVATPVAIVPQPAEMSDLDRLLAVHAIEDIKSRRDYAVDHKDWDAYLALHAPDHQSLNDGHDSWTSAQEMIAAVRGLLGPDKTSVHHSHTGEIVFSTPTRAIGIWPMEDQIFWEADGQSHWLHGLGFYHETYEKRDGRWLFTTRRLKRTHVHTTSEPLTAEATTAA